MRFTVSLSYKNKPPRGAKMIPATKSVGKTVLGVNNGCQALRRCCLNAVSIVSISPCCITYDFQMIFTGRLSTLFFRHLLFCYLKRVDYNKKMKPNKKDANTEQIYRDRKGEVSFHSICDRN